MKWDMMIFSMIFTLLWLSMSTMYEAQQKLRNICTIVSAESDYIDNDSELFQTCLEVLE